MKTKLFILIIILVAMSIISATAETICFCGEYSGIVNQGEKLKYVLIVLDQEDCQIYDLSHPSTCVDADCDGIILAVNDGVDKPHTKLYQWVDNRLLPLEEYQSFDCRESDILSFRNNRVYYVRDGLICYRTTAETINIPTPRDMEDPYGFQCTVSPGGEIAISDRENLWITCDEGHTWQLVPRGASELEEQTRISMTLGWLDDHTLLYFDESVTGDYVNCQLFQYTLDESESVPYMTGTAKTVALNETGIYGRLVVSRYHIAFISDLSGYWLCQPNGQDVITIIDLAKGDIHHYKSLEEIIGKSIEHRDCKYAGFYSTCIVCR